MGVVLDLHKWAVPTVRYVYELGFHWMHGLRLQPRDEMIGQSRQRSCNPSCRVCMRRYGVILYHIGIGLGLSMNIKGMPRHFLTNCLSDCVSHLGALSCEAKVFPRL